MAWDAFDAFDGGFDGPLEGGGASYADASALIAASGSLTATAQVTQRETEVGLSGGLAISGTQDKAARKRQISPAYAKRIIEARLRTIAASSPKKPRQKAEHAPVGIDSIAQQAQDIARTEREALIDAAVREVIAMQSRLDAQIKAEFAAIEIAAQLAIFEEEMLFMFMVACEA